MPHRLYFRPRIRPSTCWPRGHIHIPDANMCQCRIHPHKRFFLVEHPGLLPDTLLLFPSFALRSWLSFFSRYFVASKGVSNTAFAAPERFRHFPLICVWMFATYAFSFSGSIFRKLLCSFFFSNPPVSFCCFSHSRIVVMDTLNIWCVSSSVCPACLYSIVHSLYFLE